MRVVVGADVGGTKTDIRADGLDGTLRARARVPSVGWEASPVGPAARRLMADLARVVPEGDEIAAVGVGAQGCDTQEHCDLLTAAVEALGPPAAVVNDAALLVPAAGLDTGIGVIAGTGSIAVGTDAGGAPLFAGGWGWVLGDEGSAPGLVREAARAVLSAHDAGRPDDGLLSALLAHFGVDGAAGLARAVNDEPTPGSWGAAAPAVFEAADRGSALAARVVAEAAGCLAALVGRLRSRGAVGTHVVAAGGVLTKQPRLAREFTARLASDHRDLDVRLLAEPPVVGAVTLARRRLARRT